MAQYKCKICGKMFDRIGNGVYCSGPHYRPCPVCGKPVEYQRPSDPYSCCSKECSDKLADQSKRHKKVKICKECGLEFIPRQATQVYCNRPHTSVCVVCGKEFEYTCRPTEKPKTCSKVCQEQLRSLTTQQRYGVKNVSELDSVRKKISERNSSDEVKSRRASTSMLHWGVDNPAKNPDVARKMSETMSSEQYLTNRAKTCLERYGFTSPMMNDAVKERQRATNLARYGTTGHPHTREELARMMIDGSKVDEYIKFRDDPREYISTNFQESPTIAELKSKLGTTDTPIYNILIKANCRELLKSSFSSMEDSVVEFIRTAVPDCQIIRGDRTVISPDEIDIYLPEYRFGIECNPVATHNSSYLDPWGSDPKPVDYHKSKSDRCNAAGVFLFHIFGYEWEAKDEIIKSMILNRLGKTSTKIGARNCYISELSYSECKQFLDANHRQGNCSASVRLGLRTDDTDELVSVMTFGKLRHTMGKKSDVNDEWELSRFCNKLNTTVVGGASKLFKAFLSTHIVKDIISFSDVAHTDGNLYAQLGFVIDSMVPPSYTWVDKYDRTFYNRVSCQKHNLRKLFNDMSIDIDNLTETQIMESRGFAKVYDSGKVRWVYNNEVII